MPRPKGFKVSDEGRANMREAALRRHPPMPERFWLKVDKNGPNGCWQWKAALFKDGYGAFGIGSKAKMAHLIALDLLGIFIPEGMVADHTCRNRGCVSPYHLRIVTPRINSLENNDNPWAINARKTHCKHGHPLFGDNVAWLLLPTNKKRTRLGPCRHCLTCYPSYANSRYRIDPPEQENKEAA